LTGETVSLQSEVVTLNMSVDQYVQQDHYESTPEFIQEEVTQWWRSVQISLR
jgi:hypothetical protein